MNETHTLRCDGLPVEVDEIGMPGAFADHQLDDDPGAAFRQLLHERLHGPAQQLFGTLVRCRQALDQRVHARRNDPHHDCFEQLFLGSEIQVQQSLADAGTLCDVVDPRARVAALGKDVECGLGDLVGPVFLASLKAWFRHTLLFY